MVEEADEEGGAGFGEFDFGVFGLFEVFGAAFLEEVAGGADGELGAGGFVPFEVAFVGFKWGFVGIELLEVGDVFFVDVDDDAAVVLVVTVEKVGADVVGDLVVQAHVVALHEGAWVDGCEFEVDGFAVGDEAFFLDDEGIEGDDDEGGGEPDVFAVHGFTSWDVGLVLFLLSSRNQNRAMKRRPVASRRPDLVRRVRSRL